MTPPPSPAPADTAVVERVPAPSRRTLLTRVLATAGLAAVGTGLDPAAAASAAAGRPGRDRDRDEDRGKGRAKGRAKDRGKDRDGRRGEGREDRQGDRQGDRRGDRRGGRRDGNGKGRGRSSRKATGKGATSTAYRSRTVVLPTADRHLVSRFSYGVTPALAKQVDRAGGAKAWFEQQLRPASVPDTYADGLKAWWPGLAGSPQTLWSNQVNGTQFGWEVMADYQRWTLARRIYSQRQVLEVMTEFWENHLHVPVTGDGAFTHRVPYGELIRQHALGSFVDLLTHAVTHPAMGIFLDNAVSTKRRPNENLGRELLELHTVGRGHFDEGDVKDSARILTGWRVDIWKSWNATYVPADHATGPVSVVGFDDANAAADGRDVTLRYLRHLALHPATAQRICRKLAVKFVRDDPPQSLVDQLAAVYLANAGQVVPVLRALVASTAFAGAVGAKVRDPGEDIVATYRLLDVRPTSPSAEDHAANAMLWQVGSLGAVPFGWARPDGAPIDNSSWATTSRMLAGFEAHYALSGQWWPAKGAGFRPHTAWLPQRRIRFDLLVDHLSRQLLQRPASPTMLKACCEATGLGRSEVVTRQHDLLKWGMPRLLTTFLDSPTHLSR